ncbi:MAG: coiled-coil domain-containing protein [Candidatus Kapaibacteriota bacterium]
MILRLLGSICNPMLVIIISISVLAFSSCDNKEDTPLTYEGKSMEQLIAENAELEALSLEKDRLMSELMQTSGFINEIYSAMEEVKTASGQERVRILDKIRGLSDSLTASQQIIKASSAKIKQMQSNADALTKKIAELEKNVTAMKEQMLSKDTEIEQLKADAGIITQSRDLFKEQANQIAGEKERIEVERSTYYYIIGKAKDLEDRGIIIEEGSGFLGIGGTFVPGRNLNEQDFIRIDARTVRMLPIPEKYQIVSSHNPRLLEKVSGGMSIIDPIKFWNSKFLIIIDKR